VAKNVNKKENIKKRITEGREEKQRRKTKNRKEIKDKNTKRSSGKERLAFVIRIWSSTKRVFDSKIWIKGICSLS